MFASLDRVDIVTRGTDGRMQYVQTDHRTTEEVEREPELSILFALVRVLTPKRMASTDAPDPVVIYAAQSQPPAFLQQAIHAAGGRVMVGSEIQPTLEARETPPLEEIIAAAFPNLAHAVAVAHGVALTPKGLAEAERALAQVAGDPDENEIGYWSAVMKLGSFGGEVIRACNGGHWLTVESGSLPFALSTNFRGAQATINPLGKAIKRFANGEGDSVAALANLICSQP